MLDRDGVVNEPVINPTTGLGESPYDPRDVTVIPDTVDLIRAANTLGIPVAVVSNQPAAAKMTSSLRELLAVHDELQIQLRRLDARIDSWHYCFHHPSQTNSELAVSCRCRKPASGMLRAALHDLGVKRSRECWMVGDSDVDIVAGQAVGATTVLVKHPRTSHRRGHSNPDAEVSSAADLLPAFTHPKEPN